MPKTPYIVIKYVDSDEEERFVADEWPTRRAEGIDWIAIGHENFTRLSAQSVYWLYPENGKWVLGGGPVGYGDLAPETLVGDDDQHESRVQPWMPDLVLTDVKLGWWWPGTDGPVDG